PAGRRTVGGSQGAVFLHLRRSPARDQHRGRKRIAVGRGPGRARRRAAHGGDTAGDVVGIGGQPAIKPRTGSGVSAEHGGGGGVCAHGGTMRVPGGSCCPFSIGIEVNTWQLENLENRRSPTPCGGSGRYLTGASRRYCPSMTASLWRC